MLPLDPELSRHRSLREGLRPLPVKNVLFVLHGLEQVGGEKGPCWHWLLLHLQSLSLRAAVHLKDFVLASVSQILVGNLVV